MDSLPVPTVTPEWLRQHLDLPQLRLLDVRWSPSAGAQVEEFRRGHLPGASFVDLDLDLAAPPGPGGRHPLPKASEFAAAMRRCGVSERSWVVVYDEVTGAAARAWWLLRAAGHAEVSVLDGGLAAYREAGGELVEGRQQRRPGDLTASGFAGWTGADSIADLQAEGHLVLDARSGDRFRGQPSPLDPRPGHLPGAHSLPWTDLYQDGRVRSPEQVRSRLETAGGGDRPLLAYCGSGVTACALLLALETAGVDNTRLYPGSWSEWAADPDRPVELGG